MEVVCVCEAPSLTTVNVSCKRTGLLAEHPGHRGLAARDNNRLLEIRNVLENPGLKNQQHSYMHWKRSHTVANKVLVNKTKLSTKINQPK